MSKEEKIIAFFCGVGILILVLTWIWVFKWGVPLVRYLHSGS